MTLDLAAAEGVGQSYQNGHPIRCVVQPANGAYLPAVLIRDASSPELGSACLLMIYLAAGEAAVLFPPGRHFTIWADVLVGQTARGRGLLGHGTTYEQSPSTA